MRLLRRSRTAAGSVRNTAASSCSRRRLPVIVTDTLRRVTSGRSFTVGIIGGGQLARMMHAASIGLGIKVRLLAEAPDTSAAKVVHDVTVGDYTDPPTVRAF